jgi:hypothetical protein
MTCSEEDRVEDGIESIGRPEPIRIMSEVAIQYLAYFG